MAGYSEAQHPLKGRGRGDSLGGVNVNGDLVALHPLGGGIKRQREDET